MGYDSALKGSDSLSHAKTFAWGHYSEWNKSLSKGQTLHDSTHMSYLGWSNSKTK